MSAARHVNVDQNFTSKLSVNCDTSHCRLYAYITVADTDL